MAGKSMVFREVGPLIISVHSTEAPTKEEWDGYIRLCHKKCLRERVVALAVTAGGAPTSKQRAALQELLRQGAVPVAVVSDAPVVRGIVTALGWFNPAIRAFALTRAGLREALYYLDVDALTAERAVLEVRSMEREVG
jgi:hypothetical protein